MHDADLKQREERKPERDARLPLYVPVVTSPALGEAWCLNLSAGGMAILVPTPKDSVRTGSAISVEVSLPDGGARISVSGRVQWVNQGGAEELGRGRASLTLGLSFLHMSPDDRARLRRFLLEYRPHAVVVGGGGELFERCRAALEPDFRVHHVERASSAGAALGRGDVHAVVVLDGDVENQLAELERVSTRAKAIGGDLSAHGPRPRVVFCGRAPPEQLLALHNAGRLFQTVPPPPSPEWVAMAVRRACEDYALHTELRRLNLELARTYQRERQRDGGASAAHTVSQMVVESPPIRAAMDLVCVVAPHKAHVLLQGETGTGKEMFARAIHGLSDRANGPFVAIDCGALPETLLESELFGHVAGAFTGATQNREGLFQVADGGTLFLDEIENTTPALQAKLLRAIETGETRPVGGTSIRRVDVRVVAASNRDLRGEVKKGQFRADLFYRLDAFPIEIPPLRERREDILPLARSFLRRFSAAMKRPLGPLTSEAERMLEAYSWEGNVRELRNAVERAALLTRPGQAVAAAVLPPVVVQFGGMDSSAAAAEGTRSLQDALDALERETIRGALERNGGVVRRAAAELGVTPVTLGRKVRRHALG